MYYHIVLKFCRSFFENFVEIFSRIRINVWAWLLTSCVRTRVAYLTRLLLSQMPTFKVEAMDRGYHAYQDIWDALIGEELVCAREPDNLRDPFAVAVVKSDTGGPLASVPCGYSSLHPTYCASSCIKFSNRAMVVDVRARTCIFANGSGFAKFVKLKTREI